MKNILRKNRFNLVKEFKIEYDVYVRNSQYYLEKVAPHKIGRLINVVTYEYDDSRRRIEISGHNARHKNMDKRHKIMSELYNYCKSNYGVLSVDKGSHMIIGKNYLE